MDMSWQTIEWMNEWISYSINANKHNVLAPGANPKFFIGLQLTLRLHIIYVWFWILCYNNLWQKYNSKPACNCIHVHKNIGCPTRYWTRHFFNNFTTNEDIATKFEAHYRNALQTHSFPFRTQLKYSCSNFVPISSLVLELIKKCRVR